MEQTAARHAAEMLLAEHKANTTFKPFDRPHGPANVSDAYDIQDRFVGLLRAEHGNTIGYKVGLTSETMQKFCGIDHPIAGVVLANRLHRSGATIRRADFGRLGLEFEIAVRIKSDVPPSTTPVSAEAIAPYIAGVCAAIELVDDRAADYTHLDVLALLSDNSWNAGIVLSELVTNWPDLEGVLGRATKDGTAIGEGMSLFIRCSGAQPKRLSLRDSPTRREMRVLDGIGPLVFGRSTIIFRKPCYG